MLGKDEIFETTILPSELVRNSSQVPTDLEQPVLSEAQAIGAVSISPRPRLPSAIYFTDITNTRQRKF